MNAEPLLRVDLQAGYAGKPVLRAVRFELQRGEVLGLVGSSGAGKSTLVLSLLGLLPWRGGSVRGEVILKGENPESENLESENPKSENLDGEEPEGENLIALSPRRLRTLLGRSVALVPQSPMSALNAAISLESHFREAWRAHRRRDPAALRARVQELLTEVQLPSDPEFLRRRPSQVSVGQAQRVLIALALLHRPALLIADEPTSALDPVTQAQIVQLLRTLNRRHHLTLLYISHDLVSVLQLADRIAVLDAGSIVESLPVTEITRAQHPATLALLNALPVPAKVLLSFRDPSSRQENPLLLSKLDGY
jgi:peptide/nickel transport system ATP-binding protein